MLHADQDGEKLQALLRLLTELLERVRVVEALSTVPQMYCLAVVEVVRRKMFIKHYREVSQSLTIRRSPIVQLNLARKQLKKYALFNKYIYMNVYRQMHLIQMFLFRATKLDGTHLTCKESPVSVSGTVAHFYSSFFHFK